MKQIYITNCNQHLKSYISLIYLFLLFFVSNTSDAKSLQHNVDTPNIYNSYFFPVLLFLAIVSCGIIFFLLHRIKKGEKRLAIQNRRLALALHAGDVKVFGYDVNRKQFFNVYLDDIQTEGHTMEEEIRNIHPNDRAAFVDCMERLMRGEEPQKRLCFRMKTEEKETWNFIEKEFETIRNKEGKVVTIIGTRRDITEKHNIELQLQESIRKIQHASSASDMVLWEFDTDNMIFKSYNNTVNGMIDSYITLNSLKKIIHPDDIKKVYDRLSSLENGVNETSSVYFRMWYESDKQWHNCSATITPFEYDKTGKVCRYVGFRRDQTQIIKLHENLQVFSEKLNYTLQASDIRIWEYDIKSRIFSFMTSVNTIKERVTFEKFIERVDPSDREQAINLFPRMESGNLGDFCVQFKLLTSIYAEGVRYYIYNGVPMHNNENEVVSYFGITRDVTDLINIQIRLEEEKQKALAADKLKSAFLANMSHEIRTPLNAIVGFSRLLPDADGKDEKKQFIDIINENTEILLRLINDILELSKIEAGIVDIKNSTFDFVANFNNLIPSLKQRCVNPDVKFITCKPYKKFVICCDDGRVDQLITNFTINAIKYTTRGYIKVGYECVDNGLKIFVEDTGAGIAKKDQERIFNRFEKLNDFVQGTGLGLSICKAITDACYGKIGVESEVGKGSTFWAWIPCEVSELVTM